VRDIEGSKSARSARCFLCVCVVSTSKALDLYI
jgi:hypothetical protein